jgi:broad specificity phosphatase PhoE
MPTSIIPHHNESRRQQQQQQRTIWIVRHGERVDNVDADWAKSAPRGAWDDPTLTPRGLKQAREVGRRLAAESERIDFVFCSPFTRCLQTATQLLKALHEESTTKKCEGENGGAQRDGDKARRTAAPPRICVEPGFCESLHACQQPPGYLDAEAMRRAFPNIDADYKCFYRQEELPPEHASLGCKLRVQRTLKHVIESYTGNILIVSHGSPILACHHALTGEIKYVGQCTLSKYHIIAAVAGEQTTEARDLKLAAIGGGGGEAEEFVAENPLIESAVVVAKAEEKEEEVIVGAAANQRHHQRRRLQRYAFKCVLVGDSSHLSDRKDLRDVLPATKTLQCVRVFESANHEL